MSGRGIKGLHNPERAAEMCARFKGGETLQQIGDSYGMTRERVRQLIKKSGGLVGKHGGKSVTAKKKSIENAAKRDSYFLKKVGCTHSQYVYLRDVVKATRQYACQRNNARKRGISWNFNLWSWWLIWEASGKWSQRGKGQGKYCMARKGDTGAYEAGNVFICLCIENNSNRKEKKSGLPTGVSKKVVNNYVAFIAKKMIHGKTKHIGSFKTPDAADKAYQSFNG